MAKAEKHQHRDQVAIRTHRAELGVQEEEIKRLQQQVNDMRAHVQEREAALVEAKHHVAAKDTAVESAKERVSGAQQALEALQVCASLCVCSPSRSRFTGCS